MSPPFAERAPAVVLAAGPARVEIGGAVVALADPAAGLPFPTAGIRSIEAARAPEGDRTDRAAWLRECRRVLVPGGALTLASSDTEILELAGYVGLDVVPDASAGAGPLRLGRPRRRISDRPLVSVLIPAYNPRFFLACLESARAQTYPKLEILVGDDCPTDTIGEIIRATAAGDERVRCIRHHRRLGGRRNYIRLFCLARGELVKFLNDDDVLEPRCVELMLRCLTAYPEASLVTSHRRVIDEEGRALPDLVPTRRPVIEDSRIDGARLAEEMLARKVNLVGEPTTVMFRREDAAALEPHLLSFAGRPSAGNGDVNLWISLLSRGDAIYLTRTLSAFRQHPDQRQRQPGIAARGERGWRRLLEDARRTGFLRRAGFGPTIAAPLLERPWWPAELPALLASCDARLAGGDPEGAAAVLERIVELAPDETELITLQGKLLLELERLDQAEAAFRRALAVGDHVPAAHAGRALVAVRRGRLDEAEAALYQSLLLDPLDGELYRLLCAVARSRDAGAWEADRIEGALDGIRPGSQALSGWVLAGPDEAAGPVDVEIEVDGRPVDARTLRHARPDVAEAFPELARFNPVPGFEAVLPPRAGGSDVVSFARRSGVRREIGRLEVPAARDEARDRDEVLSRSG